MIAEITELRPFALPIYATHIAGFEQHRNQLRELILKLRDTTVGRRVSSRSGWQSGPELQQSKHASLAWLAAQMTSFAQEALAETYAHWANVDVKVVGFWANVCGKGAWHAPHHHLPANWSSAVYVDVEGAVTGAHDDVSSFIEFMNPIPFPASFGQGSGIAYAPRDGLAFIFPGALMHLVNPNATDADRISMSYNFSIVPRAR